MWQRAQQWPGQGSHDVTLSVFMEGTANPMDAVTTQIAMFSRLCDAEALPSDGSMPPAGAGHYKVSFAGCGVTNGLTGTLFAAGLREQCGVVRKYVAACLAAGWSVKINFVGLSRGGIGGLYLTQELHDMAPESVLLNLLLFDPVPGNFVFMARFLDWANQMNANLAMDVSSSRILGRVLVLYPYEALPSIAVHAPLIASFPKECAVEQDVILGCHQGALFLRRAPDTCLAFARIRDFLVECGSKLDRGRGNMVAQLDIPDKDLLRMLDQELQIIEPSTRISHAPTPGTTIERFSAGVYLNRSHEALAQKLGEHPRPRHDLPLYMLDIVTPPQ
mmetsp:Transcript_108851/g.314325  ORF Transcript_108851/g.314325 Transcript_108851/m.314325 type:complete len:333 (+) Transcript_108851:114-1112(+)